MNPRTLDEALALRAEYPDAIAIAGGTDLMVLLNAGHRKPAPLLDLTGVHEFSTWGRADGIVRLGAGVPYTRVIEELAGQLPGLAVASRTVGSAQIRNRGTVGGNLATASPAGDALPPLVAAHAVVELASVRGSRTIAIEEFLVGPKRTTLEPDELIIAIDVPVARGPQQFAKIGTRNAMVIAVASFALDLDPVARRVGTAIGSAGPTILSAPDAERFLEGVLQEREIWDGSAALTDAELARFGELAAAAARPIDDVRGTAAYRHHAVGVMARRTLAWAWDELQEAAA